MSARRALLRHLVAATRSAEPGTASSLAQLEVAQSATRSSLSQRRPFAQPGSSRNLSVIPASWKLGGKGSEDDDAGDTGIPGIPDISGSPSSTEYSMSIADATSASVDDLVGLTAVAEKAALEAAMEGSWLPTRTLQWVLETVHQSTGLEWWQSIMLTTVGIRAATLPIMLMQIKNTYRLSQARPEVEHLVARLKEEQARGNQNATADYQQQVMAVWKKYNCNPLKSMASVFVQAPLFIGFFSALRGLAAAKVPSMVEGGTLWFQDLTVADPTYALPVISAATFLLMVELNAADGMEGQTDKMRKRFKNIMRGVAVLIVPFTLDLPAATFMYWSASNLVSLVQSSVLKVPAIKRAVGIPVLQKKPVGSDVAGSQSVIDVEPVPGKPLTTFSQKPKKRIKSKRTKA
jgi:YidC/Oxa1 family membrane protein insertase